MVQRGESKREVETEIKGGRDEVDDWRIAGGVLSSGRGGGEGGKT